MDCKLLRFDTHEDGRGKLVSLEGMRDVPFDIKRVYWIFDTASDQIRGKHAHKRLEQVIVAINGACKFVLDDGVAREEVLLNRSNVGLYIGKNIWREMSDFSEDCVLLVLANDYYDEKEYMRDYGEFLNRCIKGNYE